MSEENVELIRGVYDALNRGDYEWIVERSASHIEFNTRADIPGLPRRIRGKDGLRQLFTEFFYDPWEGRAAVDVERIYDLGDNRILALVTFRGRGQASGVDVETRYAHIFTLRKGVSTHIEGFASWEKAKEAAGLSG
jgi:ketosteroid isomerase-like protein